MLAPILITTIVAGNEKADTDAAIAIPGFPQVFLWDGAVLGLLSTTSSSHRLLL